MDAVAIIAEERIREAAERGAFDDLPGAGKPLEFEDDSRIPEELRLAYKLLKNAGYVPEEEIDRKEAQDVMGVLERCDERGKVAQMKKLDVVLARVASRRGKGVSIGDGSPYYEKVVARVSVRGNDA